MTCTPNCLLCSTSLATICQQCSPGFSVTQTGTCDLPCADPYNLCTACSQTEPEDCITCTAITSILDEDECERAPTCSQVKNCVACDPVTPTQCGTCKLGRFLQNGICVKCPKNCEKCDSTTCSQCKIGYELTAGVCDSCSPGFISHDSKCRLNCDESNVQGCKKCEMEHGMNLCVSCGVKIIEDGKCVLNKGVIAGSVVGVVLLIVVVVIVVVIVLKLMKKRGVQEVPGVSVVGINQRGVDLINQSETPVIGGATVLEKNQKEGNLE